MTQGRQFARQLGIPQQNPVFSHTRFSAPKPFFVNMELEDNEEIRNKLSVFLQRRPKRRLLPDVKISVSQPSDGVSNILDSSQDHFRVEHVGQLADKLRFDRKLLVQQRKVVLQLAVVSDQDTFSLSVVLGATSTSQHLSNHTMNVTNKSE